ncbi:MAG: histidine kinase [Aequorivita sp.]
MPNSIVDKLELVNNKEVKALRTNLKTTFQEVKQELSWKPYDSTYSASSETTLWLNFEMENQSADTIETYLYSLNYYTTVYQQKNQEFKKIENGYYVPRPQRANKAEEYFTELKLGPFEKSQIYIRLNGNNLFQSTNNPYLYSETSYLKFSQDDFISQVNSIAFVYFYIISLLTIIVFAFVFWLRLSKRLYLYYLGYLFFQLVYGFIVLRNTLAPVGNFFEYAPKLANDLFEPVQFIFIGFYVFFILHLLRVIKYDKLLAQILKYLGLACFVYAVSRFVLSHFFYDPELAGTVFAIVRLIILPINFILIFWIIFKVKHPLLIYFIFGQSFFFIGALLASYVGYLGIQHSPESIFNFKEAPNIIFQIGLLAEVYCFSLALGQNVFLLQKEKEKTNDELIVQLQENQLLQERMNNELDEKVHKKTEELIQLYTELEDEREQKIKDDFAQRIKETEMVALRSQMNPHFIFNSLSAIKHLIMTARNDDAITYLDDFSSLLRGILQNSNRKKITVEEELEILELYLSLENKRMGSGFEYNIQASSREELSQHEIPPLLLQPIVENAIWHGLQPSLKAKKELKIIFDTTDNLKIIIEDNGIGRKESAKKEKLHNAMGNTIVQDRLTLYNHLSNHAIRLKTTDLEEDGQVLGTRITLTYQY